MLSRVADNLYWFGRYLQRVENTARLINVNAILSLDLPRGVRLGWEPLIEIVGAGAAFADLYDVPNEENVVRFLALDARYPGSMVSSLHGARENLRTTRDWMPGDVWEKLNDLYFSVHDQGERSLARARRHDFLNHVVDGTLGIYGLLVANMSHDVGFRCLRIGASLEQADMTTRIIDARSTRLIRAKSAAELGSFDHVEWTSVLRSLMAYQMYLRHAHSRVSGVPVVRFLLQNHEFPRSVMFCLLTVGSTLPHLPPHDRVQRALDRTRSVVQDADIEGLVASGLHALMDEIQKGLGELHQAISDAFFAGAGPRDGAHHQTQTQRAELPA
jgi:uncharacterized alpha-E superfamily protein